MLPISRKAVAQTLVEVLSGTNHENGHDVPDRIVEVGHAKLGFLVTEVVGTHGFERSL